VVEVGDGRAAVERAWPQLALAWATTSAGDDMVFLARAADLPAVAAAARTVAA
jgi:ribosomal protein L3 glutamine methyltransferase